MSVKSADVANQYKKDNKLKTEDVKILMEWIKKQPHLPKNITELQVILFLHSCYYSNESTKTVIDNYFTVKTMCTDIFGSRNPSLEPLKSSLDVCMFTVLPTLTPDGDFIILSKLIDCNPDKFNLINMLRYFDMMITMHLNLNGVFNGVVIAMDMSGVVFGHLTKLNVTVLKKFMYYLQEALPVRIKGLNFINAVSIIDRLMGLIKPLMKKEILDVLNIYTAENMSEFYKKVPQKCMPKEFGGEADSISNLLDKSKKLIMENANFFKFQDTQLVDEKKRPGKPKQASEFFGMDGTFKKLELD